VRGGIMEMENEERKVEERRKTKKTKKEQR
jgi:hypothetical protein